MNQLHLGKIAEELQITVKQVKDTARMIGEGATVPFIARYRKEVTGSLDEVAVTAIRDRLQQLEELEIRRAAVIKSLSGRNLLTAELEEKISTAATLFALEDIYLPFRPKRRTRAIIAKEQGLETLAQRIFVQAEMDIAAEAAAFVNAEKGIASVDEALAGARDIIAEWVNEDQKVRAKLRALFLEKGIIRSRIIPGKETAGIKYKDYYDWEEAVATAPSHRVLAMRRGEREDFLMLRIAPPEAEALAIMEGLFVKNSPAAEQVKLAAHDSYKRLLAPSMETEIRLFSKKKADETAIKVFADNLRQLLLAPPLGQQAVLAVDPGFRTGCKVACLDRQGKLLRHETIFPLLSEKARGEAARIIRNLCSECKIEAVAVGNGTASRETEAFLRSLELPVKIPIVMVNESGASVYSASGPARDEFPDHDITVRGAVSIGRRLMDPLAELVKIEPKAIGVGQYQHDVDQDELQRCLDDTVVSCVNAVGVELNTASAQLLAYVSGLGPALAENIVRHRNDNGPFVTREDIKKVKRLGAKAFEQAAGFLRVRDSANPLDASAVHPESYAVVEKMARDQGCLVADLIADETRRRKIVLTNYVNASVGLPTLKDIIAELAKPGRDPRRRFENVVFAKGIEKISDLIPGMKLAGIVTNITAFGAFVDIGIHQDGLVHLSELSDRFIKSPAEVVSVSQQVEVTVLAVDEERKRIALSMKKNPGEKAVEKITSEKNQAKREKRKMQSADARPPVGNQGRATPHPFNNPFVEALHRSEKERP